MLPHFGPIAQEVTKTEAVITIIKNATANFKFLSFMCFSLVNCLSKYINMAYNLQIYLLTMLITAKKHIPELYFIMVFLVLFSSNIFAQEEIVTQSEIIDGDTIPVFIMPGVVLTPETVIPVVETAKSRQLRRYVIKVYPLAIRAAVTVRELDSLMTLDINKKEKSEVLKNKEKVLMEQFTSQIQDLTKTQGKLLTMLIYRETGKSVYDLLKDYKGKVPTFFWQNLAKVWGQNLKENYDRNTNAEIEAIIRDIENKK